MQKRITISATLFGVLAIVFGAFGAHFLKKHLSIDQLVAFETGVKYQIYHAFFLFYFSLASIEENIKKIILKLTIFGVILFSGSIYLLTTKSISGIDFKTIGILTPIGGLLLIAAWTTLLFAFLRKKD
jgi:uncharacterized membrane protein YgdD (TMEM256/DUF423 family)